MADQHLSSNNAGIIIKQSLRRKHGHAAGVMTNVSCDCDKIMTFNKLIIIHIIIIAVRLRRTPTTTLATRGTPDLARPPRQAVGVPVGSPWLMTMRATCRPTSAASAASRCR